MRAVLATVGGASVFGALALVVGVASCGGDDPAVCGDGEVQDPEQCDDGNDDETDFCRSCVVFLPPRTTVKWRFNAEAAPGFSQDSCTDVGAVRVRVDLSGATQASADDLCSTFQVIFNDLPPGPYAASVTPLDGAGEALVSAPAMRQVTAETVDTEFTINVTPELWLGPYTGTLFFNLRWGAEPCATASPPVVQQILTVVVGGTVVTQLTATGQRLDGTDPRPCVAPGSPPQSALGLRFGLGTITVVGLDGVGTEVFRGQSDIFVGAGPSNSTFEIDVPTVYDAMPPDAMPPDAGRASTRSEIARGAPRSTPGGLDRAASGARAIASVASGRAARGVGA